MASSVQSDIGVEIKDDRGDNGASSKVLHSFAGWARVFFQGRKDISEQLLMADNLYPTSARYRHTYLYVTVDSSYTKLLIYPDDCTINLNDGYVIRKRLIVDPPIDLTFFYAVRVPGSQSGAALFLTEDDRYLCRYIFRFEFLNPANIQEDSKFQRLYKYTSSIIKNQQRWHDLSGNNPAASRDRLMRSLYQGYLDTISELMSDPASIADDFVQTVNKHPRYPNDLELQENGRNAFFSPSLSLGSMDAERGEHHHPNGKVRVRSWGQGYEFNETD